MTANKKPESTPKISKTGKRKVLSPGEEEDDDLEKRTKTDDNTEVDSLNLAIETMIKEVIGERVARLAELAKTQNTARGIKDLSGEMTRAVQKLVRDTKILLREKTAADKKEEEPQPPEQEHSYAIICPVCKGKEQARLDAAEAKKKAEADRAESIRSAYETFNISRH